MKRNKGIPRRSYAAGKNRAVTASEVPATRKLSNIESINQMENELVEEADHEEIEAAERAYEGRSSDEEDGAIPVVPPEHDPLPPDALRSPNRPPRHNI
jgi:hypothetical protein